jgi:hypothetical protein
MDLINALIFEITEGNISYQALSFPSFALSWPMTVDAMLTARRLYMRGSRGALFKVRLSSHGYTLVAKGMNKAHRKHLLHESNVYDHLRSIQGSCIPVSLGIVDLELPYYYDTGILYMLACSFFAGMVDRFSSTSPRRMKLLFSIR